MTKRQAIADSLALIFKGIGSLVEAFPNRAFTIDGRLVGDIGEVVAELDYDLSIFEVSQPDHDGVTSDGRMVQVKATFKDSLTFKTVPELYLGFKLRVDGTYEEIYNGPGKLIEARFAHRKGLGTSLLSFPIRELKALSETVSPQDRVARRTEPT